jgi:acetyl coenzyme A synthetase (ADP forming)-like protein
MENRMLTEPAGYELLKKYAIPVPDYEIAASAEEAVQAASDIGYPVVLKIVSEEIVHKSDAGGVMTGIRNEKELITAFDQIMDNVRTVYPDAALEGVIVEKEMATGLELLIGGKTDPAFGKVITFGMGGTLVELVRDVAIRLIPLIADEIREMIREVRGYRLIAGYRGAGPLDEEELIRILEAVCRMFLDSPEICEFDLNPLVLYREGACAVDARIIVDEECADISKTQQAVKEPADPELLSFNTIALVGASSNPNKIGYTMLRNLLSFEGTVYPVNPNATEILGRKVYASVLDIPETVELVIVAVPAPLVPSVLKDAVKKGVRTAVIISAGFREAGEEGRMLEDRITKIAHENGLRILGPNCLGIMLPHRSLNATFDPSTPRPGSIAFISQSGAVITTTVDWSIAEEIGLSSVISVGNQADLEFEDFMLMADSDPNTKSIVLYIEEIKNGRQFFEISRKISDIKPIIALKSGSSALGKRAASSHTGSLAGSYAVYQAAFRQAGIISVHSLREAFNVAELLASEGYPAGRRAIIVTSAGGFAVLSSDYAEENGVEVVRLPDTILDELNAILPFAWSRGNPIDMVGDAGVDRYARIFDILIRHQDLWDVAFVIAVPSATLDPTNLSKEIVRFSNHTHKVVVGCLLGGESVRPGIRVLRNAHIPNFSDLEDAFKAVGLALQRGGGRG